MLPGKIVEKELDEDEILSEDKMFAGTLHVQTLFVPDRETRWNFDMYESYTDIRDPEAMMHLNSLMDVNHFDSYHYIVPTVAYNPNHFTIETYFSGYNARSRPKIIESNTTILRR